MLKITFHHNQRFETFAEVLRLFFTGVKAPPEPLEIPYSLSFPLLGCTADQELRIEQFVEPLGGSGRYLCRTKYSPDQEIFSEVQESLIRRELKRQLYLSLVDLLGESRPWGALTGVRPTMLAAELVARHGEKESENLLLSDYGLCPEKAALLIETNRAEQAILAKLDKSEDMVYIGIPFCNSRCAYCSFIAQDAARYAERLGDYVQAIIQDLKYFYARRKERVSALYFGGGTPSALSTEQLEVLLTAVFSILPLKEGAEVTFEAGRPDSLDPEKLALLKNYPIQRICLNPQTLHNQSLKRIGRHHTVEEFYQAADYLKALNFDSVNMDLICGLPGEGEAEFLHSLRAVMALEPENITLHSLALKRAARLRHEVKAVAGTAEYQAQLALIAAEEVEKKKALKAQAEQLFRAMEEAHKLLRSQNYAPYYLYRQKNLTAGLENTGFALPGTESIYNVGMMSDRISVIGFGAGASSKAVFGRRLERYVNVKDIGLYIERAQLESEKKLALFKA
ncbi:MAG: coproporphyrinogen dehydrogenase HemZ [Eubacteriales bacterium]|nr:coproporphyrinogen dehydrogenase HemZ [Eubacteriales bacterium]